MIIDFTGCDNNGYVAAAAGAKFLTDSGTEIEEVISYSMPETSVNSIQLVTITVAVTGIKYGTKEQTDAKIALKEAEQAKSKAIIKQKIKSILSGVHST